MKVLYVCTANICRSPAAAALLREAGLPTVEVVSAGTQAVVGSPACSIVRELPGHESQPLTAGLIESADLVLTAAREHRTAVVEMYPAARTRTFTIRQAGRLAQWLLDAGMVDAARHGGDFEDGDPRRLVAALPATAQARASWVVEELDAARGWPRPRSPPRPTAGGGHDGWLSHRGIPTMSRTRTFWGPAGTRWPTSNCGSRPNRWWGCCGRSCDGADQPCSSKPSRYCP